MAEPQFIAFYGTLMKDQHTSVREHLASKLRPRGKCLIPGAIYDLGRYPSLKLDKQNRVHGELYEIDDLSILEVLDEHEAHDDFDPNLPGFTRRLVQLDSPRQTAWVYEYNGPVKPDQLIKSETWQKK